MSYINKNKNIVWFAIVVIIAAVIIFLSGLFDKDYLKILESDIERDFLLYETLIIPDCTDAIIDCKNYVKRKEKMLPQLINDRMTSAGIEDYNNWQYLDTFIDFYHSSVFVGDTFAEETVIFINKTDNSTYIWQSKRYSYNPDTLKWTENKSKIEKGQR